MKASTARWLYRSAALAAGALLGLLVAEGMLRLAGFSHPSLYRPDPLRGWALAPGAEGLWQREGEARVRINRHGLRGGEVELDKPPGTYRVALLGDSMVEALQVPEEEALAAQLERRLAGCPALPGRRVEVLNFGVSGYGTAQELLTLRHHAAAFAPDLVLLAVFVGNDVRDNHPGLAGNLRRPFFRLTGGELVLDDSFRRSRGFRLRSSALARPLYGLTRHARLAQLARLMASRTGGRAAAATDLGTDPEALSPPRSEPWEEAWAVTEALLAATAAEARARGAGPALLVLPDPIQVHPDPERRRRFAARAGVEDLLWANRRLAQAAARAGLPALDLAPPLRALAEEEEVHLHGFPNTEPGVGHWNDRGHAAAGAVAADWLCDRLSATGRSGEGERVAG